MGSARITRVAAAVLCTMAFSASAAAQSRAPSIPEDQWTWRATIYGWFPNARGETNVAVPGRGTVEVDVGPDNYLSHLDFALMGNIEARKGPWSMTADAVYFNFGSSRSDPTAITAPNGMTIPVTANTHTDLKGFVGGIGGGYSLIRTAVSNMDAVARARYLRMLSTTTSSIPLAARWRAASSSGPRTSGTAWWACGVARAWAATGSCRTTPTLAPAIAPDVAGIRRLGIPLRLGRRNGRLSAPRLSLRRREPCLQAIVERAAGRRELQLLTEHHRFYRGELHPAARPSVGDS